MEPHYQLLKTIFDIVKDDPQPERYACKPRELILRRFQEWAEIQQELILLEKENFVVMEQQETMVIRITAAGLAKARTNSKMVNGFPVSEK